MQFSFFTFFSVSCHIPGHRVFLSHFLCLSIFSTKSRILLCVFFIFSLFLAIFHVLQSVFLISHVFQCFLPNFMSYHVSFTFYIFFSFVAHIQCPIVYFSHFQLFSYTIFQVIQCFCLIFQFFQFSGHNPGHTDCISHTSRFNCFSPYYMSYSVFFSFCTFFSVSPHISCPTM